MMLTDRSVSAFYFYSLLAEHVFALGLRYFVMKPLNWQYCRTQTGLYRRNEKLQYLLAVSSADCRARLHAITPTRNSNGSEMLTSCRKAQSGHKVRDGVSVNSHRVFRSVSHELFRDTAWNRQDCARLVHGSVSQA